MFNYYYKNKNAITACPVNNTDTYASMQFGIQQHNNDNYSIILALKVILLDRLQGIICSIIQEPYLLGVML